MQELLIDYYVWIEVFHIFSVIAWMAGIFYLPRLFVYHTRVEVGSDQDKMFQEMELKLLRVIMNPAMIATWIFGLCLFIILGTGMWAFWWIKLKLAAVVLMTMFHMRLAKFRKAFANGTNIHTEKYFRVANEVPTILLLVILIMVVVKPF